MKGKLHNPFLGGFHAHRKKDSIGKDAVSLTTAKIITLLISMASEMLLSRFRTLEEYGTYSQILMVTTLAISIFTLGLPNSINYFLAKAQTDQDRGHFLSTYYSFNTVLCIVMGLILTVVTPLIVRYFKNEHISSYWYILSVLPWAKVISSSIDNVLVVYRRTDKLMIFRILQSLFLLSSILFVKWFHLTFTHYLILYLTVEACFAFSVYFIVHKLSSYMKFKIDWKLVRRILVFSVPLGLSSIMGTLNLELDKLTIGRLMTTEDVAIYTNAGRELPVAIIATSITAVLMPQIVRLLNKGRNQDAVRLWGDGTLIAYGVLCFFAISLVVYAPQVLTLLYSEKYLPGVSVFRVYSLILLLRCTYFGMILNSTGKTKFVFYTSILSLVLNVGLNILFYYIFGFFGPALATFLVIALVGGLQLEFSAKCINLKFKEIMPWKKLAWITLVNIVLGVGGFAILHVFQIGTGVKDIIITICIGVVVCLIYGLILWKPLMRAWRSLNTLGEEK